jgi:TRAP transporter TAXI family solute receptor
VRATAQSCETVFIPVAGREIEALDRENRYLLRAAIPGGLYKGAPREVPTVGFAMVAASTSKMDARAIYEIVKAVFDNLPRLQRADPVFARLDQRRMTGDGLVVPLHEGAAKLYKERGWIR